MQLFVSKYDSQEFFCYAKGKSKLWFMWGYRHYLALWGVFLVCVLDLMLTSCAQDKNIGGDIQRSMKDSHFSVIQWQQSLDIRLLHNSKSL